MELSLEKELVLAAQQDPALFGPLFDYYYPPIFGYILKRLGDASTAQDVTSDVFFKALRSLPSFSWRGISIKPWLYQIAGNEIKLYYRKSKRTTVSLDQMLEEKGFETPSSTDLFAEISAAQAALEQNEQYQKVLLALQSLPFIYQEVLTLRFLEEMKVSEIASVLNKREGTVKSLLSRGLIKLRTVIPKEDRMQPSKPKRIIATEQPLLILTPKEIYED